MKIRLTTQIGRWLMALDSPRICIIDDEEIYFNDSLLSLARKNGFQHIERYHIVNSELLKTLLEDPRDIIILDVQGVTTPDVAKDGLHLASSLTKKTNSYVVITSAHKFHLTNRVTDVDYIIEDRLLTAVDFMSELTNIVEDYLTKKSSFYRKVAFKVGLSIAKQGIT